MAVSTWYCGSMCRLLNLYPDNYPDRTEQYFIVNILFYVHIL